MTASLRLLQPTPPPLTLVLYAPARELALVLEARLPVGLHVHWQDSALPPAALEVHRRSGPCVVLLDFRRDAAAASGDLARSLQRTLPDLPLVAVGSTAPGQDEGIVAAVRTGLRDILDLESTTADIDSVLRRAAALSAPSPRAPVQAAPQAQLVLLLGVRAGVGCSTLAAHLGVLAQQCSSGDADDTSGELLPTATTLLLDLGQPAGDTALYLNLDSQFHVEDALRHASLIDGTLARTAMARHGGGLTLLGQAAGSDGGPIPTPRCWYSACAPCSTPCCATSAAWRCARCRGRFSTAPTRSGWSPTRPSARWSRSTSHSSSSRRWACATTACSC